jgi:hypothetical protein
VSRWGDAADAVAGALAAERHDHPNAPVDDDAPSALAG